MTAMKRTEYISPAVEIHSMVVEQGICIVSNAATFDAFGLNDIGWDE